MQQVECAIEKAVKRAFEQAFNRACPNEDKMLRLIEAYLRRKGYSIVPIAIGAGTDDARKTVKLLSPVTNDWVWLYGKNDDEIDWDWVVIPSQYADKALSILRQAVLAGEITGDTEQRPRPLSDITFVPDQ